MYLGVSIFCDDLILLAPNRNSAQKMLFLCEKWSKEFSVEFSTDENPAKSKSKAVMTRTNGRDRRDMVPLRLNGNELPFVNSMAHLGLTLDRDMDMAADCRGRRAIYINKSIETIDYFKFASPDNISSCCETLCWRLVWEQHMGLFLQTCLLNVATHGLEQTRMSGTCHYRLEHL